MSAQPPSIPAFYAGQPTTPQLNVMGNALGFLLAKTVFRARRTTTGTVTKGVHNLVPWDTIDEDPTGGWAAGTPTIWTVPAPGWYLFSGTVSITGAGATGTVLIPALGVNGASPTGQGGVGWEGIEVFIPTAAGDPKAASSMWEAYCSQGDQITLDCFYTAEPTANLTWQTAAGQQSRIEIVWMGV